MFFWKCKTILFWEAVEDDSMAYLQLPCLSLLYSQPLMTLTGCIWVLGDTDPQPWILLIHHSPCLFLSCCCSQLIRFYLKLFQSNFSTKKWAKSLSWCNLSDKSLSSKSHSLLFSSQMHARCVFMKSIPLFFSALFFISVSERKMTVNIKSWKFDNFYLYLTWVEICG